MQALRLARPRALLRTAHVAGRRTIAATANPAHAAPAASTAASAVVPLSNVEAQWEKLTQQEQLAVHQQLEEIQKRDWKTLSIDEKKAGASRLFRPTSPSTLLAHVRCCYPAPASCSVTTAGVLPAHRDMERKAR